MNTVITEKHPENKPHDYLIGFTAADAKIDAWDGSKEKFVGRYNKLNEPLRVIEGRCTNTPGTNEFTAAVLQFDLVLGPSEDRAINLVTGAADSVDSIRSMRRKYLSKTDDFFAELKKEKTAEAGSNRLKTPDNHLNRLINIWAKQQTLFGSVWTRWGMRGYRDIVQHALGVTAFRPDISRSVLCKALKFQYKHGMALRGWDPVDKKAYSGTADVMTHIETAMTYLEENKGIHGLCLIKYGDWNDSLTAIGKAGKGESVWLSMAYAAALLQLEELYRYLDKPERAADCRGRYAVMKDAVNTHAWEGDRYIGCYSDSCRKIYSKENREGRIYINTQSWAVISGIADKDKVEAMLRAMDAELLTGYGYLLSAPTFFDFDPEIGRITAMEPGIAENGTVYSHGNAFMLRALLQLGMGDRAYELFQRIAPGYYRDETPTKAESPAYVFTNCYYGPDHRHSPYRMEYSWITGSAAWFYHLMTEWMPGLRKAYDGFHLDPVLPAAWDRLELEKTLQGRQFTIRIEKRPQPAGSGIKIKLNGSELPDNFIRFDDCAEGRNTVDVSLAAAP